MGKGRAHRARRARLRKSSAEKLVPIGKPDFQYGILFTFPDLVTHHLHELQAHDEAKQEKPVVA